MARQLRERLQEEVAIAEDAEEGRGGIVNVFTLHAFGLRLCIDRAPPPGGGTPKRGGGGAVRVDPDKAYRVWRQLVGSGPPNRDWTKVRAAVDRLRQDGEEPAPLFLSVPTQGEGRRPQPPEDTEHDDVVLQIVRALLSDRGVVDQEDQIYHPVVHRMVLRPEEQYELVCVDEAQGRVASPHQRR